MIIVWDIDEVIAHLAEALSDAYTSHHGVAPHPPLAEWESYHSGYIRWLEPESDPNYLIDLTDHRLCDDILLNCKPDPQAPTVLRFVHGNKGKNILLSARGWHPEGLKHTEDWLSRFLLRDLIDDIVLVNPRDCKSEAMERIIEQHGPIDLFVEDHAVNAQTAVDRGLVKRAALVDRPWNRSHPAWARGGGTPMHPHVTRIYELYEILYFV